MDSIVRLNDFESVPDVQSLLNEYMILYTRYNANFINLRKPANSDDLFGVHYGADSLFNRKTMQYIKQQSEFVEWCSFMQTLPHLRQLCDRVSKYIDDNYQMKLGRVRLLTLNQKTNLRYHTDHDSSIRLHVPLITNRRIFFVIDDIVERMPDVGALYRLEVQKEHTVVNASHQDRVHLVFDLYK